MPDPTISLTQDMLQQIITTAVTAATSNLNQNRQAVNSLAEKPRRPTISSGTTSEKWSYFLSRWARYKSLAGIKDTDCSNHLIECCDDDLQLSLHRAIGPTLSTRIEEALLKDIKKFAVEEENILVSRNLLKGDETRCGGRYQALRLPNKVTG